MNTFKFIKQLGVALIVALLATGCADKWPDVEELPSPDVAFVYSIVDDDYQLDYYVGANIEFVSTSKAPGACTWDFGDGTVGTGEIVTHKFTQAGTYHVRLNVEGAGFRTHTIMITDIKPILRLNPIGGDGICEVLNTYVDFTVILPNPENLPAVYTWTFPAGTIDENGNSRLTFTGENPGKVKFSHVGTQTVRLSVDLGGRMLEEGRLNVPVAFNTPVPTLYYAVNKGNIMALKLPSTTPTGMNIYPFDLGVNSGQHALNILFADTSLYVIDCGRQFTYVNDEAGNLGDGKITVVSKDGSRVETMLTNNTAAFDDPFYGYIEGNTLYFSNRNTGISRISLAARNQSYSLAAYPFYIQNSRLGYYNKGLSYGAINGGFGKINGIWYWCKTFNGTGIFRFTDADILSAEATSTDPAPSAGIALSGMSPKSFVWDAAHNVIYFTVYDSGYEGLYRCSLTELNAIGSSKSALAPYKLTMANGKSVVPITEPGKGEGASGEFIGICQLALDPTDGSVYFGYRSGDASTPSGLMRYNPASGNIEYVIQGVSVYGVAINSTPSKLF